MSGNLNSGGGKFIVTGNYVLDISLFMLEIIPLTDSELVAYYFLLESTFIS